LKNGNFVKRPPLEIEATFSQYQFSDVVYDPIWNIEDKIRFRNTRMKISPYYGSNSLNNNFSMGGYLKLFLPESILSPSITVSSGISFPGNVFFGELVLANRINKNHEVALKAGMLRNDSYFSSLSSRHKFSVLSFRPEITYQTSEGGIDWLRREKSFDLGLKLDFFYQDYYPFLLRRGVFSYNSYGGYNLSMESFYGTSSVENHTILGFGIHEIIFDLTCGLSSSYAPLKRSMNLRETASFNDDSFYGQFKAFGGLGYQIQIISILADLLQLNLGTMVQMGFLKPELIIRN